MALLDGDIDKGERLSVEAAALGRLLLRATPAMYACHTARDRRARNQAAELQDMAAEAVCWWISAPAHAHAVAAVLRARR